MPHDSFAEQHVSLENDDSRLAGRECFRCGRKIMAEASACWVEGGGTEIGLAAHRDCINGLSAHALAASYQSALYAALTGEKERVH